LVIVLALGLAVPPAPWNHVIDRALSELGADGIRWRWGPAWTLKHSEFRSCCNCSRQKVARCWQPTQQRDYGRLSAEQPNRRDWSG